MPSAPDRKERVIVEVERAGERQSEGAEGGRDEQDRVAQSAILAVSSNAIENSRYSYAASPGSAAEDSGRPQKAAGTDTDGVDLLYPNVTCASTTGGTLSGNCWSRLFFRRNVPISESTR